MTDRKTETLDDTTAAPAFWTLTIAWHPTPEHRGRRVTLATDTSLALGRDSDLFGAGVLDDAAISRTHAHLQRQGETLVLTDTGSSNGTWVNGERVARVRLQPRDVVRMGRVVWVVRRSARPYPVSPGVWSEPMARVAEALASIGPGTVLLVRGEPSTGIERLAERVAATADASSPLQIVSPEALSTRRASPAATLLIGPLSAAQPALVDGVIRAMATLSTSTVVLWWPEVANAASDPMVWSHLCRALKPRVIELPALRDRPEDLIALADETARRDHHQPLHLTAPLAAAMLRAPWPGNLDALERFVRQHLAPLPDGAPIAWNDALSEALSLRLDDAHRGTVAVEREAQATVRIDPEGRWFERDGHPRVSLESRPALIRMLAALVTTPSALSTTGLLHAGWPGQKLVGDSGLHRVHVAINTLRSLGLRDVLLREDDGYRLDRRVTVGPTPAHH